jgi:recA bacterial DNA recombination protein
MAPAAPAPVAPVHRTESSALTAPIAPDAREHLERLLRAKKLDRTLTTAIPAGPGDDVLAAFDLPALDARLLGGIPRGHLSEVVGSVSSGRTSLVWAWLAAATRRGETAGLVDTFDRFDPSSGVACGIDLSRLLWVRGQAISKTAGAVDPAWLPGARAVEGPGTLLERTIDGALKALNLVLQARVCTAVVFDIADVPAVGLRRIPMTTWLRIQRVIEGSDTACVLLAPMPLARSAAGVTIETGAAGVGGARGAEDAVWCEGAQSAACPERASASRAVRFAGAHDRSRRLAGVNIALRLSSPRRTMTGAVALETTTRARRTPNLQISKSQISNSQISNPQIPNPQIPNPQITNSPNHLQISTSPNL